VVVVAYDCQANLLQMLLFVVKSGYFGLKWFGNRRTEMKSASKANKKKKTETLTKIVGLGQKCPKIMTTF